ncbi:exopolysaccharide production repressor protein [Mesorhizobium sp. ISC25]
MNFPQFLVGLTTTSSIVAISTYFATGSIWKTLAWTILTLIVMQVGYFLFVVRLIYGSGAKDAAAKPRRLRAVPPNRRGRVQLR